MSSPDYVWEKMYLAINSLCGEGPFIKRVENATTGALLNLNENDLTGELADDLRYIFSWTNENIANGKILKEPDELERKKLIEKMLHVMLETHIK